MAKLTDIKYRIDQLDGGAFQNLCDAYLNCRGYGTGYSLGMNTGTDKTAKGNPDTYFLTTNNKYVFVMYTTQKTDFVSKVLEDLEKCFNPEKTGLSAEDVVEIVYCHTYGRLAPGDHQTLHKFCEDRNAVLTLIGVDDLGNDLYLKYPRLAKDYLNISINTGQITTTDEFIRVHDANKMSAPLDTSFMFRSEEVKASKEKLTQSNVLVISGPAGVGKTRLALQVCEEFAAEHGYETLCIKSNGLELFDDLSTSLEAGKDYLVFVDDANELTGLHFVLGYLPKAALGPRSITKVVMTVRDYARNQVVSQILDVEKPEILKVGLLKDDDIKKLMEITFEIKNPLYLDRIVAIAEGNARLAMLAGKIASEANDLSSIRDATELYDNYYGKQIEIITSGETGIISAGIMAFFEALHLDNLNRLEAIFAATKISADQFLSDLRHFHDIELVDLRHDKAARISDQSFSNYLIKYVFVDKKVIPLSQMIKISFFINKERTISACNILFNVFSDHAVQEYLEEEIKCAWDHLQTDKDNFFPFFKAFHIVRPTETLLIIKELIDQETLHPFDIRSIEYKKTDSEKSINDEIINILCSFANHAQLPEALELLLLYYEKRPELFVELYSALVSRLGVKRSSQRLGYYTQKAVVERLCALVEDNPCDENLILFVRVAEQFLRLSFSRTESGRKDTITIYTIPLAMDNTVLQYRGMLWNQLLKIYHNNSCQEEIESLLRDYCQEGGNKIDYEIVRQEFEKVICFFSLLSTDNLYHCVIAEHLRNVAQRIEYDCLDALAPFIESPKFAIYHTLKFDHLEWRELSYNERRTHHKECVQNMVKNYDLQDFQHLLEVCRECLMTVDKDARLLSSGIEYAIEAFSSNPEMYIAAVKAYIDADTPYDIRSGNIILHLFSTMPAENVKEMIESCDFSQKNVWLWQMYVELPEDKVSTTWADALQDFLQTPPQNLRSAPYRPIDEIKQYERIDEDFIIKASRIIANHFDESPFAFSLYFSFMMNPNHNEAAEVVTQYKNDIPLLEEIYLKSIAYSEDDDSEGKLLGELFKQDNTILERYLDVFILKETSAYGAQDVWAERLAFIWQEECYLDYMNRISNYLFEKSDGHSGVYRTMVGQLLHAEDGEDVIGQRQSEWIEHTIQSFYQDKQRMYNLFSAIEEHKSEQRTAALRKFLEQTDDYELFEELPLEPSSWGGWGSMIPYMEERITYLTSLLPMLSGLKFIKHKQKIQNDIDIWRARIKHEEIEELLESLG